MSTVQGTSDSAWRPTLAAACATFVGIGLSRFAYTPLVPALILQHWFTASQAAYLGAANLAGYLAGAAFGQRLAAGRATAWALRVPMLLAAASFAACAMRPSFAWFLVWRFVAGAVGGGLMVLAAPSVLPAVPAERRGAASGIILTGVGLGIAASATLLPLLLKLGLQAAWLGLAALSAVLTALAWRQWPAGRVPPPVRRAAGGAVVVALCLTYALTAVGQVPAMLFLVDYVARGLGAGMTTGALCWIAFGIGALAGPGAAGTLSDRIGSGAAYRVGLAVLCVAVAVLATAPRPHGAGLAALLVASAATGSLVPGVAALVLARVQQVAAPADRQGTWRIATLAFSVGQAGSGYAYSFLFSRLGGYEPLFAIAAGALVVAIAVDVVTGRRRPA